MWTDAKRPEPRPPTSTKPWPPVLLYIGAAFAAFALLGCSPKLRAACDPEWDMAAWVLQCARAANPMSDEEGEDLVRQCEDTARSICPKVPGVWQFGDGDTMPCSLAFEPEHVRACKGVGR